MKSQASKSNVRAALLAGTALVLCSAGAAVNFAPVNPTWSIPMQVTTNATASGVYAPVSVITSSMSLKVTFGVTNTASSATTLPDVAFKVQDATGSQVLSWTKSGGTSLAGGSVTWIDGGACNDIRSLAAGNYRLEAKLGTSDTKYFRFAVRDTSKTLASVFTGSWRDITAKSGNDFAPPPFAAGTAASGLASGTNPTAQFGPFAPMDGIVEYKPGSEKAPLDLIFLIDLTGSMDDCIAGLKQSVATFFKALVEGDASHAPITNWRAKVVGYLDYFVDSPWYVDNDFTTSFTGFTNQLYACSLGWGGDEPESLLDAVWYVSKYSNFRDDATRVVLAFTDANYKGTGLYDDYEDRLGGTNQTSVTSYYNTNAYQEYLNEVAIQAGLAAADNDVIVKVIAENSSYAPSGSYHGTDGYHLDWLVAASGSTNSTYEYVSSFSTYFGDADAIRDLATSVSATVKEAEVVEPQLSAKITGPGILTYEWRNISSADTNNTFTFKVSGVSESVASCAATTSDAWSTRTYNLGEGTYTCQWFYKKLGYDGGLVDCGQVRNITWLRTGVPASIEIIGPSSVNSGGTGSYVAKVTYEDGTSTNIVTEASWSLASGGSYASVGEHTGVLAAGVFSGSDKTVTIRVDFESLGVPVYATKVVTIKAKPGAPSVTATDGSSSDNVTVTWTAPASSLPITSYEVSRADKGSSSWTTLGTTSSRSFPDTSALPGVDYTYRVRAQNASGWSAYGSDDGWRAVSITLAPSTLSFGYAASSSPVTVTANVAWEITAQSGCATASAGSGSITVSVAQNTTLSPRSGSVTVTAGRSTAHPAPATVSVTQGKRPAILTNLEITGGDRTLEGGEGTSFRAIATFDDGTTRDVTTEATWSITSGGKYGTVGAHTGALSTYETTDTNARLTVSASYSNSDYTPVTKSDSVEVAITFTARLRRPVSLAVTGPGTGEIGVMQQYVATVTYNDGTTANKTLDAATVWTVNPAAPFAQIAKGASAAELVPRSGGRTLTVRAEYSETVAKLTGSGTEVVKVVGTLPVTVAAPIPLPVAVDVESPSGVKICDLTITTSSSVGGNVWYGQRGVSHDGEDAGQSGYLTGAGTNTMSTVVTNAGTISFWWKVSSEPVYDRLSFSIDGVVRAQISGTNDWRRLAFPIGSGTHVLAWEYAKDDKNDAGLDAGWVDQVVWTSLAPPGAPSVTATDGTQTNGVGVTWTVPASDRDITGYEISRSTNGVDWTVLTNGVKGTAWTDTTAAPGVDYTYRVRATNEAGPGDPGEDDGWCGISLLVNPDLLVFEHTASTQSVQVASSAPWTVADSVDWIDAAKSGDVAANVSVVAHSSLAARTNTVTVTAGVGAHGTNAVVTVVQLGRPPVMDVGFAVPYEDWRTRMQISTNTTPDTYYAPVSVFTAGEPLDISFGWTNKSEVAVSMPSVHFRIFKNGEPGRVCVSDWTAAGRAGEMLDVAAGAWSGHWTCDVLRVLKPGDYLLEAEIAPIGLFEDIDRSDNTAIFRFAVRDSSLDVAQDVFKTEDGWTNHIVQAGNDFAQPPHVAVRLGSAGTNEAVVQFGPYVPMNGVNGRSTKKPLDLVFLIDYTGSMGGCIAGLVNNIGIFIDQLFLGDPAKGIDPIDDLRVKIIGFSDYKSDTGYMNWFEEGIFTSDRTLLKEKLVYLRQKCTGGGGNYGESAFDALYYVCKGLKPNATRNPTGTIGTGSYFRSTNEASRAVILFTDEPPHLPLDANGCAGYDIGKVDKALEEANINLTIIGDGYYRGWTTQSQRHRDLVNLDPTMRELIETGGKGTLATFTGNADLLRGLATNVSAKVATEAKVVEPSFSVAMRGGGTLMFDWKNDSFAGTNNIFTFACDGVTNITRTGAMGSASFGCAGSTNMTKSAGSDWETVTLAFGEGVHNFKWSYGKLGGYTNSIVTDCGVVSNIRWEPWQTELEVEPLRVKVDCNGVPIAQTNDEDHVVFDVTCNSIWKVVEHSDWINLVQGNGSGDGELVVSVATNRTYSERLGYIIVRAGEYGLPSDARFGTPERKVFIEQEANPYGEDGSVEVLTVDIKPRWPWDRKVDIDFRVKTPAKEGTPVRVKVWGLNKEGGNMITNYPTAALLRECAALNGVTVGFGSTNYNPVIIDTAKATTSDTNAGFDGQVGGVDDGMAYIYCPTSGLYRFTWDMLTDWKNASGAAQVITKLAAGLCPWANGYFHTPKFYARLTVVPEDPTHPACSNNLFHVKESEEARRVDMRLLSDALSSSDARGTGREGGSVLTGTERIGHPFGFADPIEIDTTVKSNGWINLDFMEDEWERLGFGKDLLRRNPKNGVYTLTNRSDIACVINDDHVAIEGGMITNDVHWTADKIHVVRDNVFVAEGAKLTIDEGAIVKVCIDTRIYILEDETATIVTNKHNIIVEGSYFVYPFDQMYGGNTLYLPSSDGKNTEYRSGGGGIVYSPVKSGKKIETEEIYGTTKCSNRAIYRLELAEQLRNIDGSVPAPTRNVRYRYYSKGYEYGDIPPLSEPGCAFYGWYSKPPKQTVLGDSINSAKYVSSQSDFINRRDCPFPLNNTNYGDKTIYALICPIGWADVPASVLKSATDGRIVLASESVVYDGNDHANDIQVKELWLGAVNISNSIASVNRPVPCVNVGQYPVTVNFAADYTDSPTAMFTVLPRSTEGGTITFSPASVMYNRSPVPSKPTVTVSLSPGMTSIPAGDCTVSWVDDAGRWPRPGKYKVVAAFNGNYTGPSITNEFTVTMNPAYVYTEYTSEAAARAQVASNPTTKDGTAPRRILYIGGREGDAMTEYVKDMLANDIDLCDYVSENFVCWADDIDASGSKADLYADGLPSDAPPILAIVSADDMNRAITNHAGYITRDGLWEFLTNAKTLPNLPVDASSAALTLSKASFTYNGGVQKPTVTVRYGGGTIPAANYDLVWDGDCTDVGAYAVKAVFKGTAYVGETASVAFEIIPASLPASAVTLTPPSATYDGTTHKPAVSVTGGIPFTVDYGAGDYTTVGNYTVAVTASGNYAGTVNKSFAIARRAVTATIELDAERVEISTNKPPTSPVKPTVIAVKDASRTYVEGVDYTLAWGAGDYMTVGTYTITATFIGNYSGTATATFVIARTAEAPAASEIPMIDPTTNVGVDVTAAGEAAALAMVKVRVPADVASSVSFDTYQTYFTKSAAYDAKKGVWTVTAELKRDVVLPGDDTGELSQAVLSAVLDSTATVAVIPAVRGLYYRLVGSTSVSGTYGGNASVLATGDTVSVQKPVIPGGRAFFRVVVSPEK